jgi:hypothetical protein
MLLARGDASPGEEASLRVGCQTGFHTRTNADRADWIAASSAEQGVIPFDEEAWITAGSGLFRKIPGIWRADPVDCMASGQVFKPIEANFGCYP